MSATLINLIIQIVAGALGGNAAGAASKDMSLGTAGNTIAGAIGGGVGGQILTALLPMLSNAAGSVDVGTLLGQAVGGGVTGAIVTAVVGLIKTRWPKEPNFRFGSKADICSAKAHVRFTPKSGHSDLVVRCPLCAVTLPGQPIWVSLGACKFAIARRGPILFVKAKIRGRTCAKEYFCNRCHPVALDNKHNGSGPKGMCCRCQGAVWERAAGCGPHQGLH
jgi:hypothetical protein